MKLNRAAVAAGGLAALLALAACSSSSKSGGSTTTPAGSGASSQSSSDTGSGSSSSSTAAPTCFSGTLNAAGSTAQANAMTQWINDYTKACSSAKINYNPTGSGAGITSFTANQVNFAGSDSALSPKKGEPAAAAKACGSTALDLPMVVGPIAIVYKLNGVQNLTLTPELIAKIFTGKITTWNDPAIKAANSSVTLPSSKINVIFRSDSSGTTQNFETFLSKTSPSIFTATPAKDNAAQVFKGQGEAKSQGVASAVASTEGSIAYDEYSYAVSGSLSTVAIDSGAGPVQVSKDTASAAVAAAKITGTGNDLSLSLDYTTKAAGAYPLILVTYEIVCSKYKSAATGTAVKDFLNYTVDGGQASLAGLGYAPLPASIQSKVKASIAAIS